MLLVSTSNLRGCIAALVVCALASSIATTHLGLGIVVMSISSDIRLSVTVMSIVVGVGVIIVPVVVTSLVVSGRSSAAIVVVARLTISAGLVLGSIVGIVVLVLHREGGIGIVRRFGSSGFGGLVIHVMQAHCIVLVRARVIRVCIIVSANLGLEIPRWREFPLSENPDTNSGSDDNRTNNNTSGGQLSAAARILGSLRRGGRDRSRSGRSDRNRS